MMFSQVLLVIAVAVSVARAAPSELQDGSLQTSEELHSKGLSMAPAETTHQAREERSAYYQAFRTSERAPQPRYMYPGELSQTQNWDQEAEWQVALDEKLEKMQGYDERFPLDSTEQVNEMNLDMLTMNTQDASSIETLGMQVAASGKVTDCVATIAKRGIKIAFPTCKMYLKESIKFCKSAGGKKTHAKVCKNMLGSIAIATNECDLLAQKKQLTNEVCKTLSPPKTSKAGCKAGQLFGQVPGSSTTPVCFNSPQSKQSKTSQLPLRMYKHHQGRKNQVQLQGVTHPVKDYNPNNRKMKILEVHAIPIGQGDCTVIYCPNGNDALLFDCGSSQANMFSAEDIRGFFKNINSITVFISHGHSDHYKLIPDIFDTDTIKKIKEVRVGGPQNDYSCNKIKSWLNTVKGLGKTIVYETDSSKIHKHDFCSETKIEFEIAVGDQSSKNKNERGMVMKMTCPTCKSSSLLFPGDMEGPTADIFADKIPGFLKTTHYKMAHHGASTKANSKKWLTAISPLEVHVSHAYIGKYGHPRCDAMDILENLGTVGKTALLSGTHQSTCVDTSTGTKVPKNKDFHDRVYSTAPRTDAVCFIVLSFDENKPAETDYYCGKPSTFLTTDSCDDEED